MGQLICLNLSTCINICTSQDVIQHIVIISLIMLEKKQLIFYAGISIVSVVQLLLFEEQS